MDQGACSILSSLGFRVAGSHPLGQKLEKSALFLGAGGVGMTWAMVCGGEEAAYQACFSPPAATERSQLMPCMDFPLASSLWFQSSLSESRRAMRQRWPHFCRGRPPDCASGLCFVEGELSGVAPGHRPSAHNVGQHMHARTHACPGCPRRASCPAGSAKHL